MKKIFPGYNPCEGHHQSARDAKGDLRRVKIGVFCGERWYRLSSWRRYPLFRTYVHGGFSIGPIVFW